MPAEETNGALDAAVNMESAPIPTASVVSSNRPCLLVLRARRPRNTTRGPSLGGQACLGGIGGELSNCNAVSGTFEGSTLEFSVPVFEEQFYAARTRISEAVNA